MIYNDYHVLGEPHIEHDALVKSFRNVHTAHLHLSSDSKSPILTPPFPNGLGCYIFGFGSCFDSFFFWTTCVFPPLMVLLI